MTGFSASTTSFAASGSVDSSRLHRQEQLILHVSEQFLNHQPFTISEHARMEQTVLMDSLDGPDTDPAYVSQLLRVTMTNRQVRWRISVMFDM